MALTVPESLTTPNSSRSPANRRRSSSLTRLRLTLPLPPLPLSDLAPQAPYHDDPADDEPGEGLADNADESQPPGYAPMYDYLRAHQGPNRLPPWHSPSYSSFQVVTCPPPEEPYRDEPYIVTIDPSSPPPPSYDAIFLPTQTAEPETPFVLTELESTAAEDFCKWFVGMMLITLSVASVGTAFNWGRPF